jgi:hypothetical protein
MMKKWWNMCTYLSFEHKWRRFQTTPSSICHFWSIWNMP